MNTEEKILELYHLIETVAEILYEITFDNKDLEQKATNLFLKFDYFTEVKFRTKGDLDD